DYRVVTGKLPEHRKAKAGQPDERVKPQPAQGEFVQEADQVVAPPRVDDLVNEYRVELRLTQQPVYPLRQRDMRAQHFVDGRCLAGGGQPDRYATREEPFPELRRALDDCKLRIATTTPQAQEKPREHENRARQPHPQEHGADGQVSRDANTNIVEAAQLRRPRDG